MKKNNKIKPLIAQVRRNSTVSLPEIPKQSRPSSDLYFILINLIGVVKNQADRINQLAEELNEREPVERITNAAFQIDTVADCMLDKLKIAAV